MNKSLLLPVWFELGQSSYLLPGTRRLWMSWVVAGSRLVGGWAMVFSLRERDCFVDIPASDTHVRIGESGPIILIEIRRQVQSVLVSSCCSSNSIFCSIHVHFIDSIINRYRNCRRCQHSCTTTSDMTVVILLIIIITIAQSSFADTTKYVIFDSSMFLDLDPTQYID